MSTDKKPSVTHHITVSYVRTKSNIHRRMANFLSRRPHRSFRRTRRRDYVRSLRLPGYFGFTAYVHKTLWKYRVPLLIITTVYTVIILLLVNVMSEQTYQDITSTVQETTSGLIEGTLGPVSNAAITLLAAVTSGGASSNGASSQIGGTAVGVFVVLLVWLTVVWYLRNRLAGHSIKVRDAFYNAGSPVLSTFVIFLVIILQLIPLAVAIAAIVAGIQTNLFVNGAAAMLVSFVVFLLLSLSLYWITASFMALVVVTLPGMYPLRALVVAGDMVVGRRIRILLRILWMLLVVVVVWALIMVPIIMFDGWIKQVQPAIAWLPIVPFALQIMSTFTLVWVAGYIYLLYRKVVDDDALPA